MKKKSFQFVLLLLLFAIYFSCKKEEFEIVSIPTTIELISSPSIEGAAGEEITDSIKILVSDQFGNPIPNIDLVCSAATTSIPLDTITTNNNGIASFAWKLDATETQNLSIQLLDQTLTDTDIPPVTVSATACLVPRSLELLTSQTLEGETGEEIPDSIKVLVKDQFNNPIADIEIKFTITEGNVSPEIPATNAEGIASFAWALGESEIQNLIIQVLKEDSTDISGSPITLTATPILHPTYMELLTSESVEGLAGSSIADSIKVLVSDQYGNPFSSTEVKYTLSEGNITTNSSMTNDQGEVGFSWELGPSSSQDLLLQVFDEDSNDISGSPVTVNATALRIPISAELFTEEPIEGIAGEEISDSIQVIIKDQLGDPYPGIEIKCTVSQGKISSKSFASKEDGIACFAWKLGPAETQKVIIEAYDDNSNALSGSPLTVSAYAAVPDFIVDVDGNEYDVVRIGDQIWMAQNLRTTKYSDGTAIPFVTSSTEWINLSEEDKAFCFYNNNVNDNEIYGLLYTWAAASNNEGYSDSNPSGIQGISPEGWHLPSYSEFKQLSDYLGGEEVAGGKMKSTSSSYWNSPNTGATNSSGFTAVASGYRNMNGNFYNRGRLEHYWCTTIDCEPCGPSTLWLWLESAQFYFAGSTDMTSGMPVRCIMDY